MVHRVLVGRAPAELFWVVSAIGLRGTCLICCGAPVRPTSARMEVGDVVLQHLRRCSGSEWTVMSMGAARSAATSSLSSAALMTPSAVGQASGQ